MANDIAKQIEQMLEEAWKKFLRYYKEKAPDYPKLWGLNKKNAKKSYWICWNEYDLMFYIGRFFHNILKTKEGEKFKNIEIHFEKKIDSNNFKDYEFEKSGRLDEFLNKLNEKLQPEEKRKKEPKVDMIVAYEDKRGKEGPLLLCAEVKCFHGGYREPPISAIEYDIKKLETIKDLNIAERVAFLLFDDYYWWQKNKNIANEIEKKRIEIENNEKIDETLFARSEPKLDKYPNE